MLPLRAQKLISEYSKPVTRPDWRTVCPLSLRRYYIDIDRNKDVNKIYYNIYKLFTNGVPKHILYIQIEKFGILKTSKANNINIIILQEIEKEIYEIR